jgi:hypothetical protein
VAVSVSEVVALVQTVAVVSALDLAIELAAEMRVRVWMRYDDESERNGRGIAGW